MAFRFYNRFRAVQYARTFARSYNPKFRDYSHLSGGGGDCTNFVSQCLYAGGWTIIRDIYGARYSSKTWWFDPATRENSITWSSASWFIDFLEDTDRVSTCGLGELIPGDVITHEGNGRHVMFVTGLIKNPPLTNLLLSYHTTDRLDYSFSDVMVAMGVEGYRYWHIKEVFDDD